MVATWVARGVFGEPGVVRLRPRGWAAGIIAFSSWRSRASRSTSVGSPTSANGTSPEEAGGADRTGGRVRDLHPDIRVAELRSFSVLIVILAVITAMGTIFEKKTGYNVFYSTAPRCSRRSPPSIRRRPKSTPNPNESRPTISGPTRHALSVTTILGMSLPFAVVLAAIAHPSKAPSWCLAACMIFAGALITQRKSGVVVPAGAARPLRLPATPAAAPRPVRNRRGRAGSPSGREPSARCSSLRRPASRFDRRPNLRLPGGRPRSADQPPARTRLRDARLLTDGHLPDLRQRVPRPGVPGSAASA